MALILAILCGAALVAAPDPAPPPSKTALIVAISDYPEEVSRDVGLADLPGAKNDPERVRKLLVEQFGFPPEEILILRDEAATHEAVVRAFHDRLIARAGPETEAVFWYSGHGSRVPDVSGVVGAEPDGLDSSFVCYDSRVSGRDGAYDLTDDELGALIDALARRTTRITVVTDSCHSGGSTRGDVGRVRSLGYGSKPLDHSLIEPFWPAGIDLPEDRAAPRLTSMNHVHFYASAPDQQVMEWRLNDGTYFGSLTYFLTDELRRTRPDDSYRKVARITAARLRSNPDFRNQSIGAVGDVDRRVFGSGFIAPPSGHPARVEGTRVRIEGGSMHFLKRGTQLDVSRLDDGREVGRVEIMDVHPAVSYAQWKGGNPGVSGVALAAREVRFKSMWDELDVSSSHPAIRELLAEIEGVRVVDASEATHRVEADPPGAGVDQPARIRFVDAANTRIWPGPTDDFPRENWLEDFGSRFESGLLEYERKYRELLGLINLRGKLKMEVEFVPLAARDLNGYDRSDGERGDWARGAKVIEANVVSRQVETRGTGVWEYLARIDPSDEEGTTRLARMDVTNPTNVDVYVSVISATEARGAAVVWPSAADRFFKIPAGATGSAFVSLTLPAAFGRARPMLDRYLVIATRERASFRSLEQKSQLRSAEHFPAELVRSVLRGSSVRGKEIPVDPEETFGVSWVDVLVSSSDGS